jgi:hypothetical protein
MRAECEADVVDAPAPAGARRTSIHAAAV